MEFLHPPPSPEGTVSLEHKRIERDLMPLLRYPSDLASGTARAATSALGLAPLPTDGKS